MRVAPRATYRVQLQREFDFADAAAIVPYLAELGITHLYCSPYMEAARGSTHGYDVVDPTHVNHELSGDTGLQRLDSALKQYSMGQLLDIVPNHMCISDLRDIWWWDVLRVGRASRHAEFFDIDWEAPGLEGKVLLPVLGDSLDAVLARRELKLESADPLMLAYHDQRFPIAPDTAHGPHPPVTRELLSRQNYVLEHWRTGLARVNYRRFFDIASLAAVRAEQDVVHRITHQRALELVSGGVVDGLRVDHIDGLFDPAAYTSRLRADAPDAWIVAEKILGARERLQHSWPIDGTTGYDAAARLTALQIDPRGRDPLRRMYMEFTGDSRSFTEHAREGRLFALDTLLGAELDRLARAAQRAGIADARPELRLLLGGMPVYRLYPRRWDALSREDERALDEVVTTVRPKCREAVLSAIAAVLQANGVATRARIELRARFQQLSAAATAKGVEDTAFYSYVPLLALNEVGADPSRFGIETEAFHQASHEILERWPRSLVATATHDTKRGEDARLRLAMLSEMPQEWEDAVRRWHRCALRYRGRRAPSATAAYLFFQTMVAAHPITVERCLAYMRKAEREAKQETSWLDVDPEYEAQLDAFVRGMLGDRGFVHDVDAFVRAMTPAWQVASLSQALLKCVIPGVPDIYQGCELWDLSLVDPDNRRPVDYGVRRTMLGQLRRMSAGTIMGRGESGLPKLHVIRQALAMRSRRSSAFGPGSGYAWRDARGRKASHAVVCIRSSPGSGPGVIAVAVRLAHGLGGDWEDTTLDLPFGEWHNVLTGETVSGGTNSMAALLEAFPVALLERE
ncbi:MAG TPA: malto-oligosyltrehalose synthase [Candidatus Dormibacteraeota bacterium]